MKSKDFFKEVKLEWCISEQQYKPLLNDMMKFAKLYHKEQLRLHGVVKSLNDKEVKNIEIKSLGDLKRAYPDGTSHTVNSYGRIINYSVDREIVYTRHI